MKLPVLTTAFLAAALPFGSLCAQQQPPPLSAQAVVPTANGEVGPADAPVTMVVFTDFACPFSAKLFFTLQQLEQENPQKLHVILKQSPLLSIHPEAPLAHLAALAAGRQGKFAPMAELLYSNQTHQDRAAVLAYARQLKLDLPRFERDMDSAELRAKVDGDINESHGFGINATPTTFLNGRILQGIQTQDMLMSAMNAAAGEAEARAANATDSSDSGTVDPAIEALTRANPIAETGNATAPLTIVEFTDFQCPFCRSAVEPLQKLMAARGREVRWVFRAFPLDFHPDSELATEAALAAGEQGKFWPMHDLLFANQNALKAADLRTYAQQLSLNMAKFDAALASHKFAGQIAADRVLGQKAGVSGTPTFLVDGQRISGVRSLPEWNQIADAHRGGPAVVVAQKAYAPASSGHLVSGFETAPVTLTWYTDVRSSLAAKQAELVRSLMGRYPQRLRVSLRVFPVASHGDSELGGEALLAAARQGKFWEMFDLLAARRDVLDLPKVTALAQQLGLDVPVFSAAMEDARPEVAADLEDATRRGIQGAPVFFLNDQRVDGLQKPERFVAILEEQMKSLPTQSASTAAAGR